MRFRTKMDTDIKNNPNVSNWMIVLDFSNGETSEINIVKADDIEDELKRLKLQSLNTPIYTFNPVTHDQYTNYIKSLYN